MLALRLGVVLGSSVEGWMSRTEEFSNVARQELHLLGHSSQGIDRHAVVPRLLDDISHHVRSDLNSGRPRRVSPGAGVQPSSMYPRSTPRHCQLSA